MKSVIEISTEYFSINLLLCLVFSAALIIYLWFEKIKNEILKLEILLSLIWLKDILKANPEDYYKNIIQENQFYKSQKHRIKYPNVIINPEDIKIILNSKFCINKPLLVYEKLGKFGLISLNGDEYKTHRKAINPLFTPKTLRSFISTMNKESNEFLDDFGSNLRQDAFDLSQETKRFTLKLSLKTFFGIEKMERKTCMDFIENMDKYHFLIISRYFKPWLLIDKYLKLSKETKLFFLIEKNIREFVHNIIDDHEHLFNQENPKIYKTKKIALDMMYSLRETMKFDQIREEVLVFLYGAYASTGTSIAGVLLLLAMNQDEQEKVLQEIKSVLNSEIDEIDEEKLNQLVYLEMTIHEALRLFPLALIHLRETEKEIQLTDRTVSAGAKVLFLPLEVHTDKSLWGEDAMDFKPERFSPENIEKVHPYAYFPFVKGLRTCPGSKFAKMSMKIFLSKFLMKFRVKTDLKYAELNLQIHVLTKIRQGFTMYVEKR